MGPETLDLIKTVIAVVAVPLVAWLVRTLARLDQRMSQMHQWAFGVNDATGAVKQLKRLEQSDYRTRNNIQSIAGALDLTRVQAGLDPLDLKLQRGEG